jgi:uncharacterized membrane protein HdeD (DUF308 family)
MISTETHHHAKTIDPRIRTWFWIAGIASIALGCLAILFPFAASIAAELLVGVVLAALGLVEVTRVFYLRRGGRIPWNALSGILGIIAGSILLMFPLTAF